MFGEYNLMILSVFVCAIIVVGAYLIGGGHKEKK